MVGQAVVPRMIQRERAVEEGLSGVKTGLERFGVRLDGQCGSGPDG